MTHKEFISAILSRTNIEEVKKFITSASNMDFEVDGITPILACLMSEKIPVFDEKYQVWETLFYDCFNKTSDETILKKYNGHNILYHALMKGDDLDFEIFTTLLANKELQKDCEEHKELYTKIAWKFCDSVNRRFIMQTIETPDIACELKNLYKGVNQNNHEDIDNSLQEIQKRHSIDSLLNSESEFLISLVGDEIIDTSGLLEIYTKYIDFSKEFSFPEYEETMSIYDYYKRSSEDLGLDVSVREQYKNFVEFLDKQENSLTFSM